LAFVFLTSLTSAQVGSFRADFHTKKDDQNKSCTAEIRKSAQCKEQQNLVNYVTYRSNQHGGSQHLRTRIPTSQNMNLNI
jgi:hypothetical protein